MYSILGLQHWQLCWQLTNAHIRSETNSTCKNLFTKFSFNSIYNPTFKIREFHHKHGFRINLLNNNINTTTANNNIIIIPTTVLTVPSSRQNHVRVHPVHTMNAEQHTCSLRFSEQTNHTNLFEPQVCL